MKKEAIVELRQRLKANVRDFAYTLGVETAEVLSWEAGETFPTKRLTERLESLADGTGGDIRKKPVVQRGEPSVPIRPEVLPLLQQLIEDPELYRQVLELADRTKSRD